MKTLREVLEDTKNRHVALGHFNVSDSTQFHAIVSAAEELSLPVAIGVSEGEREFIGTPYIAAMVQAAQKLGKAVYLNADHTHSVEGCKEVIDAGFDSVIFDGSKLSVEENIEKTKEVVAYAAQSGRDVIVEAELGYIGTSSKMLDAVPDDVLAAALPTAEDAAHFVQATGVSALAPAVGNLHGMLKGRANPSLHIDRIAEIRAAVDVTLVLHGGSGISDDDFRAAIAAGMNEVHINTEIRVAYRKGLEEKLAANPDEVGPYHYLDGGRDMMKDVVRARLALFNNLS